MFVGDFDNIIHFTPEEVEQYITRLKDCIAKDQPHGLKNFEIVLLKTAQVQQQEITQRGEWIDQQATKIIHLKKVLTQAKEALEYCNFILSAQSAVARLDGNKGQMQLKCDEALKQIAEVERK